MKQIFDKGLLDSFQKVMEQSLKDFTAENNLTAFLESLRNGIKEICTTIQQRLREQIDEGPVSNLAA